MSVSLVSSVAALRGLQAEWERLAGLAGTPLLGFDWFLSAAESFYDDSQLRIAVASTAGEVTGVAPLVEEPTEHGRRLTLLGTAHLFEPSGWLSTDRDAVLDLTRYAAGLGVPMLLQRLPASSEIFELLPRIGSQGLALWRAATPTLGVETTGSWTDYYGRLSSHITTNLPRLRRRAEKTYGSVHVVRARPAPEEVEGLLEAFAAIEAGGWKGRQGSALGQRTRLFEFFRRYCTRAATTGALRVSTLWFGSERAAMEIAVEAFGRHWQLKIGYQEAVARFYPGLHLVEAGLRETFERGLRSYEFLGSAEPWEQRWQPVTRHYRKLMIYPPSLHGFMAGSRDIAGFARRRAKRAFSMAPPETSPHPAVAPPPNQS